jgi:hypothetical protein
MMVGHDELARQPSGVLWHATHLGELSMLSVGEPLSRDPNLATLTDTSQGSYRRITIMGDRLVGYLSVGNAPPDSLAIKRIVDEGHSIREVIKPLLKGQFDARDYISRQRSRATQTILTQKLPPLLQESTRSGPLPRRVTEDLYPLPTMRQTGALGSERRNDYQPAPARNSERRNDYQLSPARNMERATPEPAMIYEDEINPFTGNLPSLRSSRDNGDNRGAKDRSLRQPFEAAADDFNPFTGNLPSIAPQVETDRRPVSYAKPGQSNKLLPPRQERQQSQKLWAFIDQN